MKRLLLNLTLSMLSVAVSLIGAELVLRWLRSESANTWPLYGVDTRDHTRFLPNFRADTRTAEYDYVFTTNSHGRRDVEWPPAVIAAPENLLFIGDSFVNGFGVADDATMATRLEQSFRAQGREVEVFNFGIGGAISIPEYRRLLEQALGLGIQARTVLVGVFVGNDFTREEIAVDTRQPSAPSGWSVKQLITGSRLYAVTQSAVQNSPTLTGWTLRVGDWLRVPVYRSPSSYVFLREWTEDETTFFYGRLDGLLDIQRRCTETGKALYIVLIPNLIQVQNYDALSGSVYEADRPNRLVVEYCREHDLPLLDLLPLLRDTYVAEGAPLYHAVDRHLNERGNAVAAAAVFSWLQSFSSTPAPAVRASSLRH